MFTQIKRILSLCCAYKAIFSECHEDTKGFSTAKNLRGIVLDWSDTENKGLELPVGKDTAAKLMIGCLAHYEQSYQQVADRVSASYQQLTII